MTEYIHKAGLALFLTMVFVAPGCREDAKPISVEEAFFKVAFGSCSHQDRPIPIFEEVIRYQPDLFIFLGDNIYGDTREMDTLRAKYERLEAKLPFRHLRKNTEVLAIWDDHDYGWNDAGRHYPYKEESKEIFMNFWKEPVDSERRKHGGIYHARMYEAEGNIVQVILLDTRTFRDDLLPYSGEVATDKRYKFDLAYGKHVSTDSTILGSEQWVWLSEQLKQKADVRIIASSITFSKEFNGYEGWANFPYEQKRMLDLIEGTKANGVVFISGDLHYAEISRMESKNGYPIYDITSSGLTQKWLYPSPNNNRIEGPVIANNFGMITARFAEGKGVLKMEVIDVNGNQRFEYTIRLDELSF